MRRLAGLAAALPMLAACGQPTTEVTAVESAAFAPAAAAAEVCEIEWRTISTAVEAHYAQHQVDVTSIDELVPELLREAPADWHLTFDADGIPAATPNADGRCAEFDPNAEPTEAISGNPVSSLGFPCFMQESILVIAVDALAAETGIRATSQQTLVDEGLFPVVMDLYTLDENGQPSPLFAGECNVIVDDPTSDFASSDPACSVDAIRLIFASGAFEDFTGAPPASVAEISARGYLAHPIANYELTPDGDLTPSSPLGCPALYDNTADNCEVERRTVETAIEAYSVQTGAEPTAISDLVPDYLREEPEHWTLVVPEPGDGSVRFEPDPGGPCDS